MLAHDTGYLVADAAEDYLRMRRAQRRSRLLRTLHLGSGHGCDLLTLDDLLRGLRRTGERDLGLQAVDLDTVVGTVGRAQDFDRWFRPRGAVDRQRWEGLDRALRAGTILPPVELYRVGGLHVVRDGHHRVSVAHALGWATVDAFVTEVTTAVPDAAGPGTSPVRACRARAGCR